MSQAQGLVQGVRMSFPGEKPSLPSSVEKMVSKKTANLTVASFLHLYSHFLHLLKLKGSRVFFNTRTTVKALDYAWCYRCERFHDLIDHICRNLWL